MAMLILNTYGINISYKKYRESHCIHCVTLDSNITDMDFRNLLRPSQKGLACAALYLDLKLSENLYFGNLGQVYVYDANQGNNVDK